jgi:hypothetical protein
MTNMIFPYLMREVFENKGTFDFSSKEEVEEHRLKEHSSSSPTNRETKL